MSVHQWFRHAISQKSFCLNIFCPPFFVQADRAKLLGGNCGKRPKVKYTSTRMLAHLGYYEQAFFSHVNLISISP
jgi:hypothetical protein